MFFSIGYGKDTDGKMSLNFGPLNAPGGQRRLNVAITRARYQAKLFTSFLPEEMDSSRSQSEGVKLLKEYMEFVKSLGRSGGN